MFLEGVRINRNRRAIGLAELMITAHLFSHDYLVELYGRYKTIERFVDFTAETRMIPASSVRHETSSVSSLLVERRTRSRKYLLRNNR